MSKRTTFVRHATALRIILALAVIGVALAAIGVAILRFAEDSTPDNSTTASAAVQLAFDEVCGGNRERYYDKVISYSARNTDGSVAGVIIAEEFHDGADARARVVWPIEGQSEPLVNTFIAKDGMLYERWEHEPSQWKVSVRSESSAMFQVCQPSVDGSADVRSANAIIGAVVENIRPADYQHEGVVVIEGVRLRHYIRSQGAAGAEDPTPTPTAASFREAFGTADLRQIFDEIWLDSEGRLFRVDGRIVGPYNQVIYVSTKFSGYGEPNVITAPVLPTPTPTPTAAPTPTPAS